MKNLIILFLVAIATCTFAQEAKYKPNWKEGEVKTLKKTIYEKKVKNGEIEEEETSEMNSTLKVLEVTEAGYIVEYFYDNMVHQLLQEMKEEEEEGADIEVEKQLGIQFKLDKMTGEIELINWEKTSQEVISMVDTVKKSLEDSEMGAFLGFMFDPLKMLYESEESMRDMVLSEMGFMLIPFGKDYKMNEAISETTSTENPFNPSQQISQTSISTLVSEENNMAEINHKIELDLSEFKEMMKSMMSEMAASMGGKKKKKNKKMEKEMDALEMDMTNDGVITFDTNSTWVTKFVSKSSVVVSDPKNGKGGKDAVITVLVE